MNLTHVNLHGFNVANLQSQKGRQKGRDQWKGLASGVDHLLVHSCVPCAEDAEKALGIQKMEDLHAEAARCASRYNNDNYHFHAVLICISPFGRVQREHGWDPRREDVFQQSPSREASC